MCPGNANSDGKVWKELFALVSKSYPIFANNFILYHTKILGNVRQAISLLRFLVHLVIGFRQKLSHLNTKMVCLLINGNTLGYVYSVKTHILHNQRKQICTHARLFSCHCLLFLPTKKKAATILKRSSKPSVWNLFTIVTIVTNLLDLEAMTTRKENPRGVGRGRGNNQSN